MESLVERWTVKEDMEADRGFEMREEKSWAADARICCIAGPGRSARRSCGAIAEEAV